MWLIATVQELIVFPTNINEANVTDNVNGNEYACKHFFLLCRLKEAIHIFFFSQASTAFIKPLLKSFFAALGFKQKCLRYCF